MPDPPPARSPLELMQPLGSQTVDLADDCRLIETYTMRGLLGWLWFGPADAERVVVCGSGAMGGYQGPARGLFPRLGRHLAAEGTALVSVDYRRPGRLDDGLLDMAAAADAAFHAGARRMIFLGHSFGGAVAVQAGTIIGHRTAGVVTFATQSAGCEDAAALAPTPLLLLHGEHDTILGPENSQMVAQLAGYGDVRVFPGDDHGLSRSVDEVWELVTEWLPARFTEHEAATAGDADGSSAGS